MKKALRGKEMVLWGELKRKAIMVITQRVRGREALEGGRSRQRILRGLQDTWRIWVFIPRAMKTQ